MAKKVGALLGASGTFMNVAKQAAQNKGNSTPAKSSTSRKKTSSSATKLSGAANSAYLAYMQKLQESQQKAADDAYNRNVDAVNSAYAQRGQMLKNNLDATLQNLQSDYNASRDSVNSDATKSLREAYINKMQSQKNLAQNMAAQGLSGGASETTMAGLSNNYGNARNNIETTANENLGDLRRLYDTNRNSAMQAYNDQLAQDELSKAQYLIQFQNDRQNALTTAYDNEISKLLSLDPSYAAGLMSLADAQAAYQYTPTEANNQASAVNTTQGDGTTATRNWYLNRARQLRQSGKSDTSIAQDLAGQGLANTTIQYILSQLG